MEPIRVGADGDVEEVDGPVAPVEGSAVPGVELFSRTEFLTVTEPEEGPRTLVRARETAAGDG
ncbi:hypothetical protein ACFWUZ_28815 [Streptomyces sp. NPDC058646]|uniref:hypothetical protein n=1 Tax=Streptomyces sp. NPDC058646 TaxID=3346574 RepID=UPI0036557732